MKITIEVDGSSVSFSDDHYECSDNVYSAGLLIAEAVQASRLPRKQTVLAHALTQIIESDESERSFEPEETNAHQAAMRYIEAWEEHDRKMKMRLEHEETTHPERCP